MLLTSVNISDLNIRLVRTSTRRSGTRWTWTGRTTLSATGSRSPTGRTNSPFIVIQKRTLTLSSCSPKTTVSVHECLASRYLDKSFDHDHSVITPPVSRWRQDLSYPLQESDRITLPNVPMFVSIPSPVTLIAMMVTRSMRKSAREEVQEMCQADHARAAVRACGPRGIFLQGIRALDA